MSLVFLVALSTLLVAHRGECCSQEIREKIFESWFGAENINVLEQIMSAGGVITVVAAMKELFVNTVQCTVTRFYQNNTAQDFDLSNYDGSTMAYDPRPVAWDDVEKNLYTLESNGHTESRTYSRIFLKPVKNTYGVLRCIKGEPEHFNAVTIVTTSPETDWEAVHHIQKFFETLGIEMTKTFQNPCPVNAEQHAPL